MRSSFIHIFSVAGAAETSVFNHFLLIVPAQQQPDADILTTVTASTVMECLLRCAQTTKCESASIEVMNGISPSSTRSYCFLYRSPFKKSFKTANRNHFQEKMSYNKKMLAR